MGYSANEVDFDQAGLMASMDSNQTLTKFMSNQIKIVNNK